MRILYYSHHHGSGHARNAQYFHGILGDRLHVVTSSTFEFDPRLSKTVLKDERESEEDFLGGREMLPGYLHFSPVGNEDILQRSATILNICLEKQIDLAIVDLSVEIAALLRVASVPFAYVRLPGNRTDTAHLECYKAATCLLAYYPKELEDAQTPDWIVEKTIYLGFLSNLKVSQYKETSQTKAFQKRGDVVLVVKGFGGHKEVDEGIRKLKNNLSGYYVSVGPIDDEARELYDEIINHSTNVVGLMAHSSRIVIPPSLNLTAEALNSHKPVTVIPAKRPFEEHEIMAKNLIRCGYADAPDDIKSNFKKYIPKDTAEEFLYRLKQFNELDELLTAYNIEI